jgi:hypothetical protein
MASAIKVLFIAQQKFFNKSLHTYLCYSFGHVDLMSNVTSAIDAIKGSRSYDLIVLEIMMGVTLEETKLLNDGDVNTTSSGYHLNAGVNTGIFLYNRYIKKYLPDAKTIIASPQNFGAIEKFIKNENLPYFRHPFLGSDLVEKAKELLALKV